LEQKILQNHHSRYNKINLDKVKTKLNNLNYDINLHKVMN
jgi:hypothetical protein